MNFPVKKLKSLAFFVVISICTLPSLGAEDKFSPKKIVCLSPSGAEILCALDSFDKIKARTDYCDYPEELKKLSSVGGFDGKNAGIEGEISGIEWKSCNFGGRCGLDFEWKNAGIE